LYCERERERSKEAITTARESGRDQKRSRQSEGKQHRSVLISSATQITFYLSRSKKKERRKATRNERQQKRAREGVRNGERESESASARARARERARERERARVCARERDKCGFIHIYTH